eukprot:UN02337
MFGAQLFFTKVSSKNFLWTLRACSNYLICLSNPDVYVGKKS